MAGITSLVAVGVVSTALAWPVFYRVLARSTPTVASTVTFIVPVFAAAWGALVLGEAVGLELVAAFGLVLVSLLLVLGLTPAFPSMAVRAARGGAAPDRRLTAGASGRRRVARRWRRWARRRASPGRRPAPRSG